jgi:hypothetical protein
MTLLCDGGGGGGGDGGGGGEDTDVGNCTCILVNASLVPPPR